METTLLWESSAEEYLKDIKIFGQSAWVYTRALMEAVNGRYYEVQREDYQILSLVRENRSFSAADQNMPKRPVLYFVGHYPSLPKEYLLEFINQAQQVGLAILHSPSAKWAGEKEIICIFYQPGVTGSLEKTLAFPVLRLNHQTQIFEIERQLCRNRNLQLIRQGVQILDIDSTWIDDQAEVAAGSIIYPVTQILGASRIGTDCQIGPNCRIKDTVIGRNNLISQSQIEDSMIADACNIGPFSYIRPNSDIGSRVRIGDFVEIKNSRIGDDTMISHLTYVGDADVGKNVNFGCGTILVNFDGITKHRSKIEDYAFIGCNSNLVSPVYIGKGAFIAAGSTITQDLPADSLGIARVRQQIKENWVTKRKQLLKEAKTNEQS